MTKVYICQDDLTGLFSALYDAWKECRCSGNAEIVIKNNLEQKFFCEYVESVPSEKKASAVQKLIQNHMGNITYRMLYYAALSHDPEKGNAIWGTMLTARKMKNSTKVMENMTEDSVEKAFELYRQVSNETHFFKEILRFKELENGILFAKIAPKSQVLTAIAPHFENRLPLENWMIYDESHNEFIVHEAKKQWIHVVGTEVDSELFDKISVQEEEIEKLWKAFFHAIAIEDRKSYERQRLHFPLWYRKNAVEFE